MAFYVSSKAQLYPETSVTQTMYQLSQKNLVQPSPTAQFILECITPPTQAESRKVRLEGLIPQLDWGQLFNSAEIHKVLPQVYKTLAQLDKAAIDVSTLEKLSLYQSHRKKRNILNTYELLRIVEALELQGIQSIAFKGPTLTQIAYGDLDSRSFTDLDLLLRREDYFRAREVLADYGYAPLKQLDKPAKAEKDFYLRAGEYTLFKEKGTIFADIHYRCLGGMNLAFSADFSVLWNRLEPVMIAGKLIQSFSKPDLLIYLCLNGVKDGWPSIRHVCDIAMLIQNSPELEWYDVECFSAELKVQRIVYLSLKLTEILTGISPPQKHYPKLDQSAKLDSLSTLIAEKIYRSLDGGSGISFIDEFRLRWLTSATAKDRILYCISIPERFLRLLFAVNSSDKDSIQLPKRLGFLYYLVRPLRALLTYRGEILKILVK